MIDHLTLSFRAQRGKSFFNQGRCLLAEPLPGELEIVTR